MRVMVVGLGSMGRRRIRLLKTLDPDSEIIGVDLKRERREQSEKEFEIRTCETLETAIAMGGFDRCFVCTAPLFHAEIISNALESGLHVFTEINLVSDRYEENTRKAKEAGLVLFLSSTPMYKQEILWIDREIKRQRKALFYNYHYGQYLPDWHPWENYTEFFAGDKRSSGCRELFGIEMPWILNTFGEIETVYITGKKITELCIDYPDSYLLQIEHKNGNCGMIAFDVVSRKPVRNLEVYGEDLYLLWAGKPENLAFRNPESGEMEYPLKDGLYRTTKGYNELINEQGYLDEIKAFYEVINGREKPRYSFEKDKKLLDLLDKYRV